LPVDTFLQTHGTVNLPTFSLGILCILLKSQKLIVAKKFLSSVYKKITDVAFGFLCNI